MYSNTDATNIQSVPEACSGEQVNSWVIIYFLAPCPSKNVVLVPVLYRPKLTFVTRKRQGNARPATIKSHICTYLTP